MCPVNQSAQTISRLNIISYCYRRIAEEFYQDFHEDFHWDLGTRLATAIVVWILIRVSTRIQLIRRDPMIRLIDQLYWPIRAQATDTRVGCDISGYIMASESVHQIIFQSAVHP